MLCSEAGVCDMTYLSCRFGPVVGRCLLRCFLWMYVIVLTILIQAKRGMCAAAPSGALKLYWVSEVVKIYWGPGK